MHSAYESKSQPDANDQCHASAVEGSAINAAIKKIVMHPGTVGFGGDRRKDLLPYWETKLIATDLRASKNLDRGAILTQQERLLCDDESDVLFLRTEQPRSDRLHCKTHKLYCVLSSAVQR